MLLCRQSLRDLDFWSSLTRGEGRYLVHRLAQMKFSQRRRGHGVRWDVLVQRRIRFFGFVGRSRFLDDRGQISVHYFSRTESGMVSPPSTILRLRIRPQLPDDSSSRGQSVRRVHPQLDGVSLEGDDGRASKFEGASGLRGGEDPREVASISGEQVCRLLFQDVGPGGREGDRLSFALNPVLTSFGPGRIL